MLRNRLNRLRISVMVGAVTAVLEHAGISGPHIHVRAAVHGAPFTSPHRRT
jgi:hypothetical protein